MSNSVNLDIVSTMILHNPEKSYGDIYKATKPYLIQFMDKEDIHAYISKKMAILCQDSIVRDVDRKENM